MMNIKDAILNYPGQPIKNQILSNLQKQFHRPILYEVHFRYGRRGNFSYSF